MILFQIPWKENKIKISWPKIFLILLKEFIVCCLRLNIFQISIPTYSISQFFSILISWWFLGFLCLISFSWPNKFSLFLVICISFSGKIKNKKIKKGRFVQRKGEDESGCDWSWHKWIGVGVRSGQKRRRSGCLWERALLGWSRPNCCFWWGCLGPWFHGLQSCTWLSLYHSNSFFFFFSFFWVNSTFKYCHVFNYGCWKLGFDCVALTKWLRSLWQNAVLYDGKMKKKKRKLFLSFFLSY